MKHRAQQIFEQAIERSGEARMVFVESACGGDASLRAEVESLLRAHDEASGFMDSPTGDAGSGSLDTPTGEVGSSAQSSEASLADADAGPQTRLGLLSEGPGRVIDRYKLLQQIGEGGFGTVFMAQQEEPVRRRVALKIVKLGMDTKQVLARFDAERQALALMDHPNIARVLDAGATETGRPYFVMELVTGEPITRYCDSNNLTVDERLELFRQVCAAVQHAHQKGLIHRDIKPSNVLVATQDGKPHAKVIDFGIAKATDQRLTEQTYFTEHRAMIGTPEYMSPEQAEGTLDIDTRTDVYSLGVLLYELLTGATPFDGKRLRSAAYNEVFRIIREEEPPRPSTRLSSLDALANVAAHRRSEPKRLGTLVRGDLDWIVMKALEKNRQRRYETANGLSEDIRRHLDGEPVVAAPPSAAYRMRKFYGRHRTGVLAGSLIAAALIVGFAGTIWQYSVATQQRDKAQRETVRATEAEAEATRRAEDVQRIADFQGQMLAQVDPTIAGMKLTEDVRSRFDEALERASVPEEQRSDQVEEFIGRWSLVNATDTAISLIDRTILSPAAEAINEQFAEQPVIAASLRHALAERYHGLGLDAEALVLEEAALTDRRRVLGDDHDDTLISISSLGALLRALDRLDEAERSYREVVERSRRVRGNEDPETLNAISSLGAVLVDQGKLEEGEALLREALDVRRRVLAENDPDLTTSLIDWAWLLQQQGELAEAETYLREAVDKRRKILGEDNFDTLVALNNLAVLLNLEGKGEDAIILMREITERKRRMLGEAHPSTLASMQSLGALLDQSGQSAEAEALMREALEKKRMLLGPNHTSTLATLGNLSVYLINRGRYAEAEPLCRETLDRRLRIQGQNHPTTLIAFNVMGLVYIHQGRLAEGEPYWREAVAIAQRTLGPSHHETLIYTQNLAGLLLRQGKSEEAEPLLRTCVNLGIPSIGIEHPIVISASRRLGEVLVNMAQYQEAIELLAPIEAPARDHYTSANSHYLAATLRDLGKARAGLEQFTGAEANLLESYSIMLSARGEDDRETLDIAGAIAEIYEQWHEAEPDAGHDATAAKWRAKLAGSGEAVAEDEK